MNYKMMGRIFAEILALEAFFMLPPLFISIYDGVDYAAKAFLYTIGILIAVSAFLWLICRKAKRGFYAQEGIVCVGLGWIFLSLFGALPFFISGEIPFYIDAFFEMVSGFTTTGASIVPVVEDLSRGILYWRSFSHWLGGMGVLVFLLAIVPSNSKSGGSRLHLLKAESPGPDVGKLVPKMRDTAMILYVLYIVLTLFNILFLLAGKMPLFDALCTAFGTAGTGGFGIKNDSIAGYSIYIQWVCTVFMMLFGVNFNCYYLLIMRQFKALFKNEEVRCYFGISIMSAALIAIDIRNIYPTIHETIRHACFQVASRFDSQVVLDDTGAQDLLGKGDMLFKRPGQGVQRVQGCMVAESEVLRVVEELKAQGAPEYVDAVTEPEAGSAAGESGGPGARRSGENDPLYDEAVQMVIQHKRAATSFVQRRFNIGYNRAANLLESMEAAGIVSKPNPAGKREVLVKDNTEAL